MNVFTREQLSEARNLYLDKNRDDNDNNSKEDGNGIILLAFMGEVFDVSSGARFYGKGGGYNFFSFKDATRAYITGEFNEEELIDDVSDFEKDPRIWKDLLEWRTFYFDKYVHVGVVNGSFYDEKGKKRKLLLDIEGSVNKTNEKTKE